MNLLAVVLVSFFYSAFGKKREANIILFPPSFLKPDDSVIGDDKFVLRLRGVIYQYGPGRAVFDYRNGGKATVTPYSMLSYASPTLADRTRQIFTETPKKRKFDLIVSVSTKQQLVTDKDVGFGDVVVVSPHDSATGFVTIPVEINDSGGFMVDVPTIIGDNLNHDSKQIELLIDEANIGSTLTDAGNSPTQWVQARIHSQLRHEFFIATETRANIIGLQDNELQIITDVDDTVKESDVNHGFHKMIKAGLFAPHSAIPGVTELFQHIIKQRADANLGKTGFHFVSASPWALLTTYVNDFFMANGFPWASYSSRVEFPRGIKELSRMAKSRLGVKFAGKKGLETEEVEFQHGKRLRNAPETLEKAIAKKRKTESYTFKRDLIVELARGPSWNQVMFFGDSTESDSEAAMYLVQKYRFADHPYAGKVVCIFLHFVASGAAVGDRKKELELKKYLERVKFEFQEQPSQSNPLARVRVFNDPTELMDADFTRGSCHSENSIKQWEF